MVMRKERRRHNGSEQPRIGMLLGYSLVYLLICAHRSFICLLCTAELGQSSWESMGYQGMCKKIEELKKPLCHSNASME